MKKCASKSQNRICARFYGPAIPYSSTTRKSTASRNSTSARTVRWSINTFCLASERRATTSRRATSYAVFCLKKKRSAGANGGEDRPYHLLEGFPFTQEPPSRDCQELVLIRPQAYH